MRRRVHSRCRRPAPAPPCQRRRRRRRARFPECRPARSRCTRRSHGRARLGALRDEPRRGGSGRSRNHRRARRRRSGPAASPHRPAAGAPQSVAETSPEPARVRDTTPTPEPTPTPTSEPSPLAPQPTPAPTPEVDARRPLRNRRPRPTLEPTPSLEPTAGAKAAEPHLCAAGSETRPAAHRQAEILAAPKATASRVAALEPAKPANPARRRARGGRRIPERRPRAHQRVQALPRHRAGARRAGNGDRQFHARRSGQVAAAALVKSAGDSALDADAVETVRRAAPFPPPPAGAPRTFSAPLNYVPR